MENSKHENNMNRRNFISLLLTGGVAFAVGSFAALFGKRQREEAVLPENTKPAAYWKRVE